jgi:two-component system cell cycle response regulator
MKDMLTPSSSGIGTAKKNPRILVVEDQPDNLFILKEVLERGNFQVITAKTGEEALEKIQNTREEIDLVLSDIMMPGISGIMLCETIKTDANSAHIPVMLITSLCLDE